MRASAGEAFSAWDGYISGLTLLAAEGSMIVQTWRADDWESEAGQPS